MYWCVYVRVHGMYTNCKQVRFQWYLLLLYNNLHAYIILDIVTALESKIQPYREQIQSF